MFQLTDELIAKIKGHVTGEKLAPAGVQSVDSCDDCYLQCGDSCTYSCDLSCDNTCDNLSYEGTSNGGGGW